MEPSFSYSIRLSDRARHARIVVRPNLKVEVVLPRGVAKSQAARLVREKQVWVERSLKRFRSLIDASGSDASRKIRDLFPPKAMELTLIRSSLPVVYQKSRSTHVRVSERSDALHLTGAVDDEVKLRAALERWLKYKGREHLVPMLQELAETHGFSCRKVSVRLQRSRWGSCSRNGTISLNAKLLFLPEPLVRYVMLHELAHLEELNHSAAFWQVVERCDSRFGEHRRSMRRVTHLIPGWLESR